MFFNRNVISEINLFPLAQFLKKYDDKFEFDAATNVVRVKSYSKPKDCVPDKVGNIEKNADTAPISDKKWVMLSFLCTFSLLHFVIHWFLF